MKRMPRLLEVFRRFIMEAKCPRCGTDGAYVGLNSVECKNKKCTNFVAPKIDNARLKKIEDEIRLWGIRGQSEGGVGGRYSSWENPDDPDAGIDMEDFAEVMKGMGMEEHPDDPFGGWYDPKHWKLTNNQPSSSGDSIYTGHYDEWWFIPVSPQAKALVRKTEAGSADEKYGQYDRQEIGNSTKTDLDMAESNGHEPYADLSDEEWNEFFDAKGL